MCTVFSSMWTNIGKRVHLNGQEGERRGIGTVGQVKSEICGVAVSVCVCVCVFHGGHRRSGSWRKRIGRTKQRLATTDVDKVKVALLSLNTSKRSGSNNNKKCVLPHL